MVRRFPGLAIPATVLAMSTTLAWAQPAPPPTDAVPAAPQAAAAPAAAISNGLITARILLPDAQKGFYRGTRFDWSGAVQSLVYKNREFYGLWFTKTSASVRDFAYDGEDIIAGPQTSMTGPADEFDTAKPLGWDAAAVGGVFVKIGVGVLRKPDEANYAPFRTYEIVDPGKRTSNVGKDAVTFTHELTSAATGYGYLYKKTLRLPKGEPRLLIEHSLKNTGAQPITTTVYNHNFVALGGEGVGEGLTVSAPFQIKTARPPAEDAAAIRGDQIVYLKPLRERERVAVTMEGFGATAADNRIKVRDPRLGMAVTFTGDQPLTRMQLWSIRSVVAVEPFVTLTVEPGQEVRWTYAYDYEVGGRP
jgi:hypothetical protein